MEERRFKAGEVIFRQGEVGDSFFQILEGNVGIYSQYGTESEEKLTELGKGQIFGEMAIIDAYPRSATALAATDVLAEEITDKELLNYINEDPDRIYLIINHLGEQLRRVTADYKEASAVLDEIKQSLKKKESDGFFGRLKKFSSLYKKQKKADQPTVEEQRISAGEAPSEDYFAKINKYPRGTVIFKEGTEGDCMYSVQWGTVGIFTGYGTDEEKKLTELGVNTFFGEMGLISKEPRSATAVVLQDDTVVETIFEQDLKELFKKNPVRVHMILSHLSRRLRSLTNSYLSACRTIDELYEDSREPFYG